MGMKERLILKAMKSEKLKGAIEKAKKDMVIWEKEIRANERAKYDDHVFHDHIKAHFEKEHPNWKVICKICNKTYDEIVKKGVKK